MKQQRFRIKLLALLMFGLFLVLAVYGGYSVLTYGNRWFSSSKNPRVRAQKQDVIAGDILDRNGVVLATSMEDGTRVYQEDEDARRAVVHVIGDAQGQVSNGVQTFQTSWLYGFNTSIWERLGALFSGQSRRGDDVTLTIDSRLCTAMADAFDAHTASQGKRGAAVVMNYRTGQVLGMISLPSFDPMGINTETKSDPGQPFWNRATQSLYAPGSTFKIVTTEAGLLSIPGIESMDIGCSGGLSVDGQAIHDYAGAVHQTLSLKKAFTVSCNNAYALIACTVGDEKLKKTAQSFGFGDNFLFRDLVVENSTYPTTNRTNFEIATSGFGQSAITATPMHMCMIAAAVANDGVMMEPILLRSVNAGSSRQKYATTSRVYRTAMTAQHAAILKRYMRAVVTEGTGTRAAVKGLTICGKTGTAQTSLDGRDVSNAWFVGFCDDASLPFAVAVIVQDVDDGLGGGSVAAPIASDIFAYLKQHSQFVTN